MLWHLGVPGLSQDRILWCCQQSDASWQCWEKGPEMKRSTSGSLRSRWAFLLKHALHPKTRNTTSVAYCLTRFSYSTLVLPFINYRRTTRICWFLSFQIYSVAFEDIQLLWSVVVLTYNASSQEAEVSELKQVFWGQPDLNSEFQLRAGLHNNIRKKKQKNFLCVFVWTKRP